MNYIKDNAQKIIKAGEVWLANFPYEDDPTKSKIRPVIVLTQLNNDIQVTDIEEEYLSVKVTGHKKRKDDDFDTVIVKWKKANLDRESVARVSKTMQLPISQFKIKLGDVDETDFQNILEKYLEYINI